jgi:hypothetical protein
LWASCDVGTHSPDEKPCGFTWGNVIGRDLDEYCVWPEYETTPGFNLATDIPVNETYDAAYANMKSPWRMPTKNEFKELIDNCVIDYNVQCGDSVCAKFTSIHNGNFILFRYNVKTGDDNTYNYSQYWTSTSNIATHEPPHQAPYYAYISRSSERAGTSYHDYWFSKNDTRCVRGVLDP